jgi:hypothetical protein
MIHKPLRIAVPAIEGQKILDYLQQRPYNEVFGLIPILMNAETLPAEEVPVVPDVISMLEPKPLRREGYA